jgi:hypothetical protein
LDFNPAANAQGTSGIGSPNLRLTADGSSSDSSGMGANSNPAAMDPGQGTSNIMTPNLRFLDYKERWNMAKTSRKSHWWDEIFLAK